LVNVPASHAYTPTADALNVADRSANGRTNVAALVANDARQNIKLFGGFGFGCHLPSFAEEVPGDKDRAAGHDYPADYRKDQDRLT
jgi:hypothetical protein